MNIGGVGEVSYARNSQVQRRAVDDAKKFISESIFDLLDIENLSLESSNRFQIADLGCVTGPNTFFAVQNIIEAVDQNYKTKHRNLQTLEYHVFFSDRVDNDFNTLFRTLPSSRPYFAVGVPGSFYGRLFPKESIHIMYSSNSLNWLSRVPNYVVDINSPVWNGNSIYYREELVGKGLMALVLAGRQNGLPLCQTGIGKSFDLLGSCLFDMANEGIISKEKVESLNLPLNDPSEGEIVELINNDWGFSIEKMRHFQAQ
ncbi:hypothetical protein PTKIN_Ptkin12aG0045000 [Pterospermum kingtungense]